ncbi:unnamed protein product [Sphenostylis stenocarpa]|uniref:Uncharacterized protein n=1 Tax=Sphenostylis stenocarpa TaxID=92480 RepID=A0AA86S8M6_9FABA|nr:unnamed protein product [Sphenostylis stenocarpa]
MPQVKIGKQYSSTATGCQSTSTGDEEEKEELQLRKRKPTKHQETRLVGVIEQTYSWVDTSHDIQNCLSKITDIGIYGKNRAREARSSKKKYTQTLKDAKNEIERRDEAFRGTPGDSQQKLHIPELSFIRLCWTHKGTATVCSSTIERPVIARRNEYMKPLEDVFVLRLVKS